MELGQYFYLYQGKETHTTHKYWEWGKLADMIQQCLVTLALRVKWREASG